VDLNRFRALIHRRIRYRITGGGALFVLAIGLTGFGAFLSGNNLLFLIFSAMLALLLVSGFISRLVLSGLELELLLPEHVAARMPTAAHLRLRNLKRFTPSFSIELSGRRDSHRDLPPILRQPIYFPVIPGRDVIEVSVQVVFPFRGRHRENLFLISTKFPFGFLRKSTTVALRRDTIVYPALEPVESLEILLDSVVGELESQIRGEGRDFYRIRPYESQDSARHVDWKSTAHTGALQVREFTRDRQRTVEIFFDRRIGAGQTQQFEQLLEQCAWFVWRLSERDARMHLRSQRFTLALPEEGDVYDLLKFLALVEPIITAGLAEDPEEASDMTNLQILFSTAAEPVGWSDRASNTVDTLYRTC
jgi:uncharacterized protein (DUF58 family)